MADGLDHPLDLVFSAFMDRDFKPGVAFGPADLLDLRRGSKAIFEFDAPFERFDFGVVEHALHFNQIGLGHMVARMKQRLGQITMIREQHESFAIEIQSADREHADGHSTQIIFHGRTTFGIIKRGHDVLRLVQD